MPRGFCKELQIPSLTALQQLSPREAAIHIVRLVNSRNMNVAMQALTLLDNCVKNCGYPFHLQISTKEFLNELVRKFPERPNVRLYDLLIWWGSMKVYLVLRSRRTEDVLFVLRKTTLTRHHLSTALSRTRDTTHSLSDQRMEGDSSR
ncbi:VHS domain-containing protein [Endogone sp. FLAS-F59071]|nr:VHS domain-containing protein [Endogone sp. FLAS-F59071]|eukprot:RUS14364.1 VHS domain-containing protein [Endogone sp. FLAS-F59071]